MQIYPLNALNPLNPLVETRAIPPAVAVGTHTQTGSAQTGTGETGAGQAGGFAPRTTIGINQQRAEIELSFPPGHGEAAAAAAQAVADAIRDKQIELQFSRDDDTGTIVIKLVNQLSGETVRQFPTEALLRLSAALGKSQGQLFDQEA